MGEKDIRISKRRDGNLGALLGEGGAIGEAGLLVGGGGDWASSDRAGYVLWNADRGSKAGGGGQDKELRKHGGRIGIESEDI